MNRVLFHKFLEFHKRYHWWGMSRNHLAWALIIVNLNCRQVMLCYVKLPYLRFPKRTDSYNKSEIEVQLVSCLLSTSAELIRTTFLSNFLLNYWLTIEHTKFLRPTECQIECTRCVRKTQRWSNNHLWSLMNVFKYMYRSK